MKKPKLVGGGVGVDWTKIIAFIWDTRGRERSRLKMLTFDDDDDNNNEFDKLLKTNCKQIFHVFYSD